MKRIIESNRIDNKEPGMFGHIYQIGPGEVAKVLYNDSWTLRGKSKPEFRRDSSAIQTLEYELRIAKELDEGGVHIPKPIGIYPVRSGIRTYPAFVMEYVNGLRYSEIPSNKINLAEEKLRQELTKVVGLGFVCDFQYHRNSLWLPNEEGICLLDFADWAKLSDLTPQNPLYDFHHANFEELKKRIHYKD